MFNIGSYYILYFLRFYRNANFGNKSRLRIKAACMIYILWNSVWLYGGFTNWKIILDFEIIFCYYFLYISPSSRFIEETNEETTHTRNFVDWKIDTYSVYKKVRECKGCSLTKGILEILKLVMKKSKLISSFFFSISRLKVYANKFVGDSW